jgi:hypothetical protein
MKKTKERKREHIDWQLVKDKGTGFFGRPTPQYWEAREAAWGRMEAPVREAISQGGDADFLRACILYLAELAARYDSSKDSIELPAGAGKVVTSRHQEGLALVGKAKSKTQEAQQDWNRVKGLVEPDDPDSPTEPRVDRAFAELLRAIDEYVDYYGEGTLASGTKGRPGHDEMLLVLSGMDRHLQARTRKAQRPLLLRLASVHFPQLPIVRTTDQLRSALHGYRKRKRSDGNSDLRVLMKKFTLMRNNLKARHSFYNA